MVLGRFHCCKRGRFPSFPTLDPMCGYSYKMDIKYSKRIRKNITDPQKAAHSATSCPRPGMEEWQGTPQGSHPSHQMHTFSSSISQAKRLTGNSCFWAQSDSKAQNQNPQHFQVGTKAVWDLRALADLQVTRRACNHFLVLSDHYPPCPLHDCWRDTEQVLSWDASSSSVTECVHAYTCVFMCMFWVVNGIILKLHYIFSIKHTTSINSSTKTPMWMVYCLHLTPNFTEGEGVKEN